MAQTLTETQRRILSAMKGSNYNFGSSAILRSFRNAKGKVTVTLVYQVDSRPVSVATLNALIANGYVGGFGPLAISDHAITARGRNAVSDWY
jgi:hypothetical protein